MYQIVARFAPDPFKHDIVSLEERTARFQEVTNGYGKVLFLYSAINSKNEPLGCAPSSYDATSSFSLLLFNL
jgi:hypothetical protein